MDRTYNIPNSQNDYVGMEAKDIKKVHCFFEQSGTFKNEFIKMGILAEDYDIQNNFGQTDHVIDLFCEIDRAYDSLTRQDKTRQDSIRFYRPMSRLGVCLFSMHLLRNNVDDVLFMRNAKQQPQAEV